MSNKKHVFYLGSLGFPYGLAEVQKIILISNCLQLKGNEVTVLCRKGTHNKTDRPDMAASGHFQGTEYIYTSGTPFYPEGFFQRNLLKLKGRMAEFSLLRKRKKANKLDFAILSTHDFYDVFYYTMLSKLFGFKIVLNYVEFYSGIKKKPLQIKKALNDRFFDTYGPKISDGILPISEFIIAHMKKVAPKKPYLKIPGLTDFDRYNGIETVQGDKYFLFCGDAGYKETIYFIIDSFDALTNSTGITHKLYLVINGKPHDVADVKNYISNSPKKDLIKYLTKLPERDLFSCYKNALALLIPLRPTFQDIARFPHKIGEYLASGNPVISTNYGEVKYYFKDKDNMLIAETYDVQQFIEKMQFVIDNPELAKQIGLNGKKIASQIFDYREKAAEIDDFFNMLNVKQ